MCVAARGGLELAVLNCYYIKVKCLFVFTLRPWQQHYSFHAASVTVENPALWHGSLSVSYKDLSHTLVALEFYSHSHKRLGRMSGLGADW